MAIDGEPKDGDFVRYIDMLNRQAGIATPGQVQRREGRASRRGATLPADILPSPNPAPVPATSGGTASDAAPANATLAARTGQRRIALGLTIAGVFALWHAVGMLLTALDRDPIEVDDLIPVVFLAVCAFMLFKGGSRLRAAQRAPLAKLPPLSTLPGGKKHRT
ncbi:hypothetical protein [Bordetella sp. BOR01]|uniref:hypothetical protein n=1 Tax=Bordetella sp. BOR01 TaxID=2854779 RepID=UPI002107175F|nr:hypothetical protein [Bordetella sp. BOR01]